MASSNPVKVVEVSQVPPLSDSPESATELSLPLTFFDTQWFKFPPTQRIFYYKLIDLTPTHFYSIILPKLKQSLSLTLLHFLPLAGNIIWPPQADKPFISYTPKDGVSFTVGESSGDFDYLSGNKARKAIDSHPYVPELPVSDSKASTIALQITLFPNQGFCIGISSHHAVLDGKSTAMFMKAWAHTCKESKNDKHPCLLPELTPFFDRTAIQDPEGLDLFHLKNWQALKLPSLGSGPKSVKVVPMESPPEFVRATLEMSREKANKLKEKLLSSLSNKVSEEDPKSLHLSTFVVTYAYTLSCMAKAKGLESNRMVIISIIGDCRTLLDPPVPANYFGNCVTGDGIITEAGTLMDDEKGFIFAAEKLSEAIKGLGKGILERAKANFAEYMAKPFLVEIFGIAGSHRFNVYGADFGWGRPKKVEITSIDRNGSVSVTESRDGSGGIEVGLAMKQHELENFEFLFANGLKDL